MTTIGLKEYPIIAAVKDDETFEAAIKSKCNNIFLLNCDILILKDYIERAHAANKKAFLHFDLCGGISNDEYAVRFIQENFEPDGIITTKPQLIKKARDIGLFAIYRSFIFDNLSLNRAISNINGTNANCVELLPGIMPSIIPKMLSKTKEILLIVGGLVETETNIRQALDAGADGVSTSKTDLWNIDFV